MSERKQQAGAHGRRAHPPPNWTSLIEAMISLKNERAPGGSASSKSLLCRSQSARSRMSASLMHPLLLLYAKTLHCEGWNTAAVMTWMQRMVTLSAQVDSIHKVDSIHLRLECRAANSAGGLNEKGGWEDASLCEVFHV